MFDGGCNPGQRSTWCIVRRDPRARLCPAVLRPVVFHRRPARLGPAASTQTMILLLAGRLQVRSGAALRIAARSRRLAQWRWSCGRGPGRSASRSKRGPPAMPSPVRPAWVARDACSRVALALPELRWRCPSGAAAARVALALPEWRCRCPSGGVATAGRRSPGPVELMQANLAGPIVGKIAPCRPGRYHPRLARARTRPGMTPGQDSPDDAAP